jgi:hypothetical protein
MIERAAGAARWAGEPECGLELEPPFFLPAEFLSMGANSAHDTRCAASGKRAMSVPISAFSSWAPARPTPGISSSLSAVSAKGAICSSIRAVCRASLQGVAEEAGFRFSGG